MPCLISILSYLNRVIEFELVVAVDHGDLQLLQHHHGGGRGRGSHRHILCGSAGHSCLRHLLPPPIPTSSTVMFAAAQLPTAQLPTVAALLSVFSPIATSSLRPTFSSLLPTFPSLFLLAAFLLPSAAFISAQLLINIASLALAGSTAGNKLSF